MELDNLFAHWNALDDISRDRVFSQIFGTMLGTLESRKPEEAKAAEFFFRVAEKIILNMENGK